MVPSPLELRPRASQSSLYGLYGLAAPGSHFLRAFLLPVSPEEHQTIDLRQALEYGRILLLQALAIEQLVGLRFYRRFWVRRLIELHHFTKPASIVYFLHLPHVSSLPS